MISTERLQQWVVDVATLLEQNKEPDSQHFAHFINDPELALRLIELISKLDEKSVDENHTYYSACIIAFDVCIAQLQAADERGHKAAGKLLDQIMSALAATIRESKQSLSFWLPVLNAFYEVHVTLSDALKDAYLSLAQAESDAMPDEDISHLGSIRELIQELSDLSVFDIAENFFAQSYAMSPDFFADLVLDLYSIEEGQDIAVLTLLHPNAEVRNVVVAVHDQLLEHITLSPISLSRLQTIKHWYPPIYHDQFNRWIKEQRKKSLTHTGALNQEPHLETPARGFSAESPDIRIQVTASEIDGGGAQGIFIHWTKKRKARLCGLLFKQNVGIKDAWITPIIAMKDMARYYDEAFDESVVMRTVDLPYLSMMTSHFLALTIEQGNVPDLHLLEIQEELGVHWFPRKLDIPHMLEQLAVQINPFTPEVVAASLKRSKTWSKNKAFTESWYVENTHIDKLVNRCCSFVDGVKTCRFEEAEAAVLQEEMEKHREKWLFHFLWVALWLKAKARKTEKLWMDSFIIAYVLHTGMSFQDIPIMHEICHQSVVNSVETMQERRTHLT